MGRTISRRLVFAAVAAILCACHDTGRQPQPAGATWDGPVTTAGTGPPIEPPPQWRLERTVSGLAHGAGTFVAVGSELEVADNRLSGAIYTSNDGVSWSRVDGEFPGPLWNVAFGGGRFVATGAKHELEPYSAAVNAYVATDGQRWEAVDLPAARPAERIAYGQSVFVVPVDGSHALSRNGSTWTPSGTTEKFTSSVEFANGRFVSWSGYDGRVDVLEDDQWTTVNVPLGGSFGNSSFHSLRAVGDRFVALIKEQCCMGERPTLWGLASSADGRSWQIESGRSSSAPLQPVFANDSFCVAHFTHGALSDVFAGEDCDSLVSTFQDPAFVPQAVVYADGVLLLAGDGGIIRSTEEGRTWTRVLWNE